MDTRTFYGWCYRKTLAIRLIYSSNSDDSILSYGSDEEDETENNVQNIFSE